jgi:hypothetical protein
MEEKQELSMMIFGPTVLTVTFLGKIALNWHYVFIFILKKLWSIAAQKIWIFLSQILRGTGTSHNKIVLFLQIYHIFHLENSLIWRFLEVSYCYWNSKTSSKMIINFESYEIPLYVSFAIFNYLHFYFIIFSCSWCWGKKFLEWTQGFPDIFHLWNTINFLFAVKSEKFQALHENSFSHHLQSEFSAKNLLCRNLFGPKVLSSNSARCICRPNQVISKLFISEILGCSMESTLSYFFISNNPSKRHHQTTISENVKSWTKTKPHSHLSLELGHQCIFEGYPHISILTKMFPLIYLFSSLFRGADCYDLEMSM